MNINEITSFNAQIMVKDSNGNNTVVAYLSANLDAGLGNYSINVNTQNKSLLNAEGAVNVAGETVQAQYAAFVSQIETRAKELGYAIFA